MRLAYTVLIIPGEPDEGGYWVKVPAIPGCVTQGETVEEAVTNAREAIEAYVLRMKERGILLPEEGSNTTALISTVAIEV